MYLQKNYNQEFSNPIRLSDNKKKIILTFFDFYKYNDELVLFGIDVNKFKSNISHIVIEIYNDYHIIHLHSSSLHHTLTLNLDNYTHNLNFDFSNIVSLLIKMYDDFFKRTSPDHIFLKIVINDDLENQEQFVLIENTELDNIIILIQDYIIDGLNNIDNEDIYIDYINRIHSIILYPSDFMLKIHIKYPDREELIIFKDNDDDGDQGEIDFEMVCDYIKPLYRKKLLEQTSNNTLGGNSKDYYIDKHNKKYNRKIIIKGSKKFVRYNSKIIELKMYKEVIKKEKQVQKAKK